MRGTHLRYYYVVFRTSKFVKIMMFRTSKFVKIMMFRTLTPKIGGSEHPPKMAKMFRTLRKCSEHWVNITPENRRNVQNTDPPVFWTFPFVPSRQYIRTIQTQNFRNDSKSALRKSKIYIYEHFLGKIFEISKNLNIYEQLYIRTLITVLLITDTPCP